MNLLINIDDELSTAYFIKENYIDFNDTATLENAEVMLNKQIDIMISKNIPEFNDVYKMLQNWKQEIINSFNLSFSVLVNSLTEVAEPLLTISKALSATLAI